MKAKSSSGNEEKSRFRRSHWVKVLVVLFFFLTTAYFVSYWDAINNWPVIPPMAQLTRALLLQYMFESTFQNYTQLDYGLDLVENMNSSVNLNTEEYLENPAPTKTGVFPNQNVTLSVSSSNDKEAHYLQPNSTDTLKEVRDEKLVSISTADVINKTVEYLSKPVFKKKVSSKKHVQLNLKAKGRKLKNWPTPHPSIDKDVYGLRYHWNRSTRLEKLENRLSNRVNLPCMPSPSHVEALRFFVVGDWGLRFAVKTMKHSMLLAENAKSRVRNEMELCQEKFDAHFVASLGDNFYMSGVETVNDSRFQLDWDEFYFAEHKEIPWYLILGNHDHYGNVKAQVEYAKRNARWKMPDLQFAADYLYNGSLASEVSPRVVRFVYIDTCLQQCGDSPEMWQKWEIDACKWRCGVKYSLQDNGESKKWFEETMLEAQEDKRVDVIVVIGHQPIVTSSPHQAAEPWKKFMINLIQRFHKWRLYFCGHNHGLEITQLKRPQASSFSHMVIGSSGYCCHSFYNLTSPHSRSSGDEGFFTLWVQPRRSKGFGIVSMWWGGWHLELIKDSGEELFRYDQEFLPNRTIDT